MTSNRILTLSELFADRWVPAYALNGVQDWEPEWFVQDMILKNGVNYLIGPGTIGKSYLRTYMLVMALTGAKVFDVLPTQQPENVLILMGERNRYLEGKRLFQIGESAGLSEEDIYKLPITMLEPAGFKIDRKDYLESLALTVETEGFDLVMIDPLKAFHDRKENDSGSMSVVNNFMRWFCQQVTLFVVHHEGKPVDEGGQTFTAGRKRTVGERSRGTSDIGATADVTVSMVKLAHNLRAMEFETNWAEERPNMRITFDKGLFRYTASSAEEAVRVERASNPNVSGSEIARKHRFRKEDVLAACKLYDEERE